MNVSIHWQLPALCLPISNILCAYGCLRLCVCASILAFASVYGNQRLMLGCLPQSLSSLIFERVSSLSWNLPFLLFCILLDWLASEPLGFTYLCPSIRSTGTFLPCFYVGVWGSELIHVCLCDKHFTPWAISLTLLLQNFLFLWESFFLWV